MMSDEKPFFIKFNPKDYIADTVHLSATEHGVYLLLIMRVFINEGTLELLDDDKKMARRIGVDLEDWIEAKEVVLDFFTMQQKDGKTILKHKRIDRELMDAKRRINNAKAAAKSRWRGEAEKPKESDKVSERPKKSENPPSEKRTEHKDLHATAMRPQCGGNAPLALPIESESESELESEDSESADRIGGQGERKAAPKSKRAKRIDPNWRPSEADRQFAVNRGFTEQEISEHADTFKDYWIAVSGQRATKVDWSATWRNWLRKERPGGERRKSRKSVARTLFESQRSETD